MCTMIRLTGLLAFAAFGLSGMPMVAHAQTYPNKSISVVVPFPAGGPSDVVARIVTEHMGRTLGQQMVVENVAGAGGTLGTARVAAAPPDGYTLLAGSMGSHVAAPVLTPNVKYDSERDFEPIGLTAHAPAVIVARKDFPASNLSEFLTYLKQNSDKVKQAHGGIGASSHGLPAIQSGVGHQADVSGVSRYCSSDERSRRWARRFSVRTIGQRGRADRSRHGKSLCGFRQPAPDGAA
jgi:tripartite-type tricarboxylate transporter receptor subunit TctC